MMRWKVVSFYLCFSKFNTFSFPDCAWKLLFILSAPLVPYGIEFICELFRFLISLCNPTDKQNSEKKLHIGLTLLTVALEVGADSIGQYQTLLTLVKDDLCKNMFCVSYQCINSLHSSYMRALYILIDLLHFIHNWLIDSFVFF